MPLLNSAGESPTFHVGHNNGIHIKTNGMSGSIQIVMFDENEIMGPLRDDTNVARTYTTDFDVLLDLRANDVFQIVQTGGTPLTTRYTVAGADG